MAKAKRKDNDQIFSFEVKSGENVEKYNFRRSAFNDPQEGRIEVKDMFDDKGNLKSEHAGMVQNLVKIRSGVIQKEFSSKVKPASGPDDEALEALKKQYEELTGNKPGNKRADTLQKEIEEFNAKKQ